MVRQRAQNGEVEISAEAPIIWVIEANLITRQGWEDFTDGRLTFKFKPAL